ncbi:MAG: DNA-directed RNA polymerase subunit beta [Deltaproteobacteria bacterium]|nr:DNA-directed RNA polymerase subunit beta [Deltaproteobacteria bacterium]MBW1931148.1 DNA-directed RNA polymerase subunit beta [Deltaproteobacteria bacterium]MBW2025825.1 DNA-directed RNA polymerase subunit beta [Deltaproteobacteria bacterium]MBW2125540.1 DNA-directed RNA polymerase subunit beta [Deltaproteobacteria bacterium]RLB17075.1 MAG: DNA-directed RNA polymerase subunit beta [Deltaproteobacteria bacterium]
MSRSDGVSKRIRRNFGKIQKIIDIPNLIEVQKRSYERFLQKDVPPEQREEVGLQGAFKSVFPIQDFSGTSSLEFVKYTFEDVKYDEEDCLNKGMTYEAPLRLTVRLLVFDTDSTDGTKSIRDIKEQEIYFGTLPMMTERGTFIINGTERVVVNQLHRSPGVFFDHDKGKTHSSGKLLYSARIIPLRGSWLDFEFDPKDLLYVRIDRRRKFPVTVLLKALGYSTREILSEFYRAETIIIEKDGCLRELNIDNLYQKKLSKKIVDPKSKKVLAKEGDKYTKRLHKILEGAGITHIPIDFPELLGRVLADDVVDPETGEVLLEGNTELTEEAIGLIRAKGIKEIRCLVLDAPGVSPTIRETMTLDKIETPDEAVLDIYRKMRPSSPPTQEVANNFFRNLFFNINTYDLSAVGRLKINHRLKLDVPLEQRTLRKEDILATVKELIQLKNTEAMGDDIDNLGNRRVRAVGELLENQYRIGLVRMERAIKERMSLQEVETLMPHDLINSKPVSAVVKEFFGTSQLSQFMDQTNPLSEITHKRRLSALGPGGLTRERAGFEVRDVHPTHYGRICPIETPEGPNIGLIVSLSTYARVNEFGFIETPYREVADKKATNKIKYLSALDEGEDPIAQANAPLDKRGRFLREEAAVRIGGEAAKAPVEEIKYMDVSPDQLVSVSASLIPFLEHDDANRALMGSNMQRQAVPLLKAKAPLVGTGIEKVVARDSGVSIVARRDGVVEDVDASRIVIRSSGGADTDEPEVEIYKLTKFKRSNQNTCYNQKPIVKKGEFVKKGQIIADGPAMEMGELALGQNVMVAFMSWGGYNFEDSILISERVVKEDIYTSVHIEEFEVVARDTKLGREEITRDIPNVGEEALKNLDESGIIKIGAEVKPGDILVGKITPKGETQLSPEEKLLRAIFGDKAGDVKDTSLRVPPGVEGIVIDAKVFSRRGVEKDTRTLQIEAEERARLEKDRFDEVEVITRSAREKLKDLLVGKKLKNDLVDKKTGDLLIKADKAISKTEVDRTPVEAWANADLRSTMDTIERMEAIVDQYKTKIERVETLFREKLDRLGEGDELAPGVIKMVKVYVAVKRKLSVGDKMAGRHGNKGVLSRILPVEDMPYFEDGTPVDIILNPLGVPSRMNVGQVLETHLGWASKELGRQVADLVDNMRNVAEIRKRLRSVFSKEEYKKYFAEIPDEELLNTLLQFREGIPMATPVFDGAQEDEIIKSLELAGLPVTGQTTLYDGRTGEPFDQKITVGVMYIMKLHHLVDDKIHARSIGPYSLVTQQPLGGKAQFGGQRLGEMEVWAMEAYGAAYALQEFLTVKSDDVAGRTRMYERIVKGNNVLEAGLPESFKVLMKELQSLGLEIQLFENAQG